MTDLNAIILIAVFAIGGPSWAAFLWFTWCAVRAVMTARKARRSIRETRELLGRVHREDLLLDVRIPPTVKV